MGLREWMHDNPRMAMGGIIAVLAASLFLTATICLKPMPIMVAR